MVAIGFRLQLIQMERKLLPSIAAEIFGLPLIQEQLGRHVELAVRCVTGMLWLQAAMEII
jgi:hypothetical protein